MMTATYRHMLEKKLSEFLFQEAEVLKERIFDCLYVEALSETPKTNLGKIFIGSPTPGLLKTH